MSRLYVLSNQTTSWTNQKAAAAMSLTGDVYDFYSAVLNRSGFNGDNGKVRIVVNDDINGDPTNAYSSQGATRAFTVLSFGHAGTISADLVGHEFNHSVEQATSGLVYEGESGAIMEAMADVFGELFEDWVIDGQLDDDCDWIHGSRNMIDPARSSQEQCYYEYIGKECPVYAKNNVHYRGEKVKEPGWLSSGVCAIQIPYPKTYKGENYFYGTSDHSGVHTNHTVISHAAYLMTHPQTGMVEALSNEELAKVLYYALSYLPSDCSFTSFAKYVCLSAEVLNLSETKQDCIVQAFNAVGIEADNVLLVSGSSEPLDYMVTEESEWNIFGKSGMLCDNYTLYISGKETLLNLYHTGPLEESDTNVTEYPVSSGEPLTLVLEPGYMYNFEFVDGTDPDNTFMCKVGVHEDSLGLIDVVDIYTQFGPALVQKDNGLVFLTERPSMNRPGLFTFRDYELEGYVYESERGGYSIETIYPRNLNTVAHFVGDFTHSGEDIDFTVKKEWDTTFYEEKLWLQIEGVIKAGVNDFSLYNNKETYYYIIDGEDTAYLICEMVEYDNFDLEGGGSYSYCTGEGNGQEITETIIVINMSNYKKHTFIVSYNTRSLSSSYTEKVDEFMGESKTNNLFYTGYSNEGQFDDYSQVVRYIQDQLGVYGLADRVFSEKSELSNYTPVYTTTVTGSPKTGTVNDYESSRVFGKGTIGFPTYTGTWFSDGIVRGPVVPPEDNPEGENDGADFQSFIANRGYMDDWIDLDISSFYTLGSYSLIDIDQDGTDELIILSESDMGFAAFLVYDTDDNGKIIRLSVGRSEAENNIISCYGEPRYSPKYKALVFSETKPTAMYGGTEYFVVAGDCMYAVGMVGFDSFINEGTMTYYTTMNGSYEEISEDDRNSFNAELQWLDYTPLP